MRTYIILFAIFFFLSGISGCTQKPPVGVCYSISKYNLRVSAVGEFSVQLEVIGTEAVKITVPFEEMEVFKRIDCPETFK